MSTNPCDVITVRCAACGKLREQANHWFLVWLTLGFHCYPFDIAPRQPDDLPVCGQACAQKEFERWMMAMRNGELLATSSWLPAGQQASPTSFEDH